MTADTKHAHAVITGWLREALSFSQLEMALSELDGIIRICERLGISFSALHTALDELILSSGATEQRARTKRHRVDPAAGLDAPLPGEQGSIVELSGLTADDAASLCCVAGKYLALFERPLLALGAFRAARSCAPHSCSATDGMAYCLLAAGRREAAAALAMEYWHAIPTPTSDPDAGSFLFTLLDVAPSEPPAEAAAVLANIASFVHSGACSAVRSLAQRWLPAWLAEQDRGAPSGTALARQLGGEWTSWLGMVARNSSLFSCAALEPVIRAARAVLCDQLMEALRDALSLEPIDGDAPVDGGVPGAAGERGEDNAVKKSLVEPPPAKPPATAAAARRLRRAATAAASIGCHALSVRCVYLRPIPHLHPKSPILHLPSLLPPSSFLTPIHHPSSRIPHLHPPSPSLIPIPIPIPIPTFCPIPQVGFCIPFTAEEERFTQALAGAFEAGQPLRLELEEIARADAADMVDVVDAAGTADGAVGTADAVGATDAADAVGTVDAVDAVGAAYGAGTAGAELLLSTSLVSALCGAAMYGSLAEVAEGEVAELLTHVACRRYGESGVPQALDVVRAVRPVGNEPTPPPPPPAQPLLSSTSHC